MYFRILILTIVYFAQTSTMETAAAKQFKQSLVKACQAFDIKEEPILGKDLADAINSPQTTKDPYLFDFYAYIAAANTKNNNIRKQQIDYLLGLTLPPLAGIGSLVGGYALGGDACIKAIGCLATLSGFLLAPVSASYWYTTTKESTDKMSRKLAIQKLLEEGNSQAISSWLAVLHTSQEHIPKILAAEKILRKKGYNTKAEIKPLDKKIIVTIEHDQSMIATTELQVNEQGKIILQQEEASCV